MKAKGNNNLEANRPIPLKMAANHDFDLKQRPGDRVGIWDIRDEC